MTKNDLRNDDFLNVLENTKNELILNFHDKDGFLAHIDPTNKQNAIKKAMLLGTLTLFNEFRVSDLIDNIDDVVICQSILQLASNIDTSFD